MKVRELIAALSKADPELTVCQFSDYGAQELSNVAVFNGRFDKDRSPKMTWTSVHGRYVCFGFPGDFDATRLVSDCAQVEDLWRPKTEG